MDVFVVQGWVVDDAANLNKELAKRLAKVNWDDAGIPGQGSVNGTGNGSAQAIGSVGTELNQPDSSEWEIAEAQLNFHDKIASGVGTTAARRLLLKF